MNRPFRLTALALSACLLTACGGGGGGGDGSTGGNADNPVNPPPTAAVLATSIETLTLATLGTARRIILNNTGGLPVLALQATTNGFPAGSSLDSNCPTDLPGGASCELVITPGGTPTARPGDRAPVTATISVTSTNTPAIEVRVSVLTYGSVTQGGYVFALDDTTPATGGIGGKVLALQEMPRAYWSPSALAIEGINDNSLAGPDSCDGAVDGRCNTDRIVAQYPSDQRNYAAALCADSQYAGFTDWYMPAMCELAYDNDALVVGICGTREAPRLADNAKSRLSDSGPLYFFDIAYWSSTQSALNPERDAHMALYDVNRFTSTREKQEGQIASKCARYLTP